ncbi:MAG: FtsQ-type POTRA domain-containing protein [Actinomycetota bacterium]
MTDRPATRGWAAGPPRSHWHWGWTLSLTGLLLAAAAAVALHSPWFKLQHIEIVGAVRADVAGRVAHAGIGPGAFMIWLPSEEIERAVAADPWVREVRVERILPNRLVVEVLEHTPAAWVGGGSTWMLVSRAGVVVAVAAAPGEGLLRARVPYAAAEPGDRVFGEKWAELVGLGTALSPVLAAEAWVTSEGGELWIEARGFRARLGPAVDLADKGRAFEALLAADLPTRAVIDLVAPSRPAVSVPGVLPNEEGEAVVEDEDGG